MFDWLKNVINNVKDLNISVDEYKNESIIQSIPSVAYVNKAKTLIEEKDYDKAEIILRRALDISQDDSIANKYLGKIYELRLDFANAVEYYKKSSEINPNDKEIWLRLGMCQLNSKKVEDAILSFEQANKVTAYNTDVYTGWGMALMKQKKYALAHDKFLMASQISKYNYTAILLSAIMEVKLGEYDSADEKLKFLSKVAPNESSTYEYANLKLIRKDYEEAEKYAQKSLEYNSQMLPSYLLLGEIYSIQRNKEKFEHIYEKALENDLESSNLRRSWGNSYIRIHEFKKAKEQFFVALKMNDEDIESKIGLALTQAYEGDFELVKELRGLKTDNPYMQEAMGLEALNNKKPEDAIDCFKKAIKIGQCVSYNYYNLAKAYRMLNDKYKVKENYERFLSENPDNLQVLIEYSKWLIVDLDNAEAQRKLKRAEKISKNNVEVLNLLFLSTYSLVKNSDCEYNIKEAISIADRAKVLGRFEYENEEIELQKKLVEVQGKK